MNSRGVRNVAEGEPAKWKLSGARRTPKYLIFVVDTSANYPGNETPMQPKQGISRNWRFVANKPKGDPCNRAAFLIQTLTTTCAAVQPL
jgi:hypothetical protein